MKTKKIMMSLLVLSAGVLLSACGGPKAQPGSIVTIKYSSAFEDGTSYEKDINKTFTIGSGQVIQGLEEAVLDMHAGDTETVTLTPEKTYSADYNKNKLQHVAKIIFDKMGTGVSIGQRFTLGQEEGIIKGTEKNGSGDDFVLFDTNPLYTQLPLVFTISLENIQ